MPTNRKKQYGIARLIILSQSYEGTNRFSGYCIRKNCHKRIWQLKYIYKNFKYQPNKK